MSEAYQVLSDEKLREKYDKYGLQDGILPDGGFMNAEKFFQQMFGGEKFQPIIGDLALGKLLSEMAVAEQASANTTDQTNPATAGSTQANDASVTPGKAAADDMFSKEKMAAHHAAHAARVNQLVANLIEKTRFLVVDKKSAKLVSEIKTQAFFSFHHANAYECGEEIVSLRVRELH